MGTKNDPGRFDNYANLDPDEPYFVVMARDTVGAAILRTWAAVRERYETVNDPGEIDDARTVANQMEAYCASLGRVPVWILNATDIKTTVTRAQVEAIAAQLPEADRALVRDMARAAGVEGLPADAQSGTPRGTDAERPTPDRR